MIINPSKPVRLPMDQRVRRENINVFNEASAACRISFQALEAEYNGKPFIRILNKLEKSGTLPSISRSTADRLQKTFIKAGIPKKCIIIALAPDAPTHDTLKRKLTIYVSGDMQHRINKVKMKQALKNEILKAPEKKFRKVMAQK